MIKTYCKLFLLLSILILSACTGNIEPRPTAILNAGSYTHDGVQAYAEADWQRAQFFFTKALLIYQGVDDQQGVLLSHINLAEIALAVDDYPTVDRHLEVASIIANKTEQANIQSRITLLSAQSAFKQNQLALAIKHLTPLLPEFDNVTPVSKANQIQLIACADRTRLAFAENNDAQLWTQRYANALRFAKNKDLQLESRLLRYQAILLQQQGNLDAAESNLQQALINYKQNLSRPGIAITLSELGQLYMAQDRWQDAKEYFSRSLAVNQYLNNTKQISRLSKILMDIELHLRN